MVNGRATGRTRLPKLASQWDETNLARMQKGRAPQRWNADKGGRESMELSHEPVPFRDGGTQFVPQWPQDHAAVAEPIKSL